MRELCGWVPSVSLEQGIERTLELVPGASGDPAMSETDATVKQLNLIRLIAIVDLVLLIPLLMNLVGIVDSEAMISVIGPIHGFGFLALLFLCVRGVGERRWGWWFPAIVLVTLGPPGSLYGEWRIRRELVG